MTKCIKSGLLFIKYKINILFSCYGFQALFIINYDYYRLMYTKYFRKKYYYTMNFNQFILFLRYY